MSLEALGISAAESRAYEWLVGRPSATAEEAAAAFGEETSTGRRLLAQLESSGLATSHRPTGTRQTRYVAAPPTVALGALLRERRDDLQRVERRLEELVATYLVATPDRPVADIVEVVTDRQAVAERFRQVQAGAQQEVLAFVVTDVAAVSGEENVEEDRALDRGVVYRVLAERPVLDRPGFLAAAEVIAARGGAVRAVATLPARLLIADRALAMVPVGDADPASAGGALLIHTGPLLDLLIELYETVWATAVPVAPAPTVEAELEPLDARILLLFAHGLTDRAVASQLGLSLRTVQRRARALMDLAGVASRFRLGVVAAQRGWVE